MINNGIVSQNPFGNIFDDLFNRSISDIVGTDFTYNTPGVNITEGDDTFEVQLAAPGLEKEDFNVTIEKDHLVVSADKQDEKVSDSTEGTFKRKEFNFQKFTRKFRLPEVVDKESISAKYDLGILKITLHKIEKAKDKESWSINID